ncbi:hypothetical protein SteCoe_22799 [Stentor coeruleus]|uniref:Uncharacterized protein n=1 Tax=Stentor coeruleus TaxID=5963 RepID=A0A1R2BLJ6_9CILI|nr:hypothetical protein SteCoe_22799 [Stentor coeruleus]
MESKGFLDNFTVLASGVESSISQAVDKILETLKISEGHVETKLGNITPDLKYTIDRLLKGLTGGKSAKIGFSIALTTIFRVYPLKIQNITDYFNSIDHSGISPFQISVGFILLALAVERAQKTLPKSLIDKIVEIYKTRTALKESAAVALIKIEDQKPLIKKLATSNDAAGLMLHYSMQSDESIMNQSSRHKDIIVKGSFKALPRLHQIWKLIITASIRLNKESTIWELFIEKDLPIDDKKKPKRTLLSFLIFQEYLSNNSTVSKILTKHFYNFWQDNLFCKKMRDHSLALNLKTDFLAYLLQTPYKKLYLQKCLDLSHEVKTLDMLKTFSETLLNSCELDIKEWFLEELSKFTKNKKGNFAVNIYWHIGKSTSELRSKCIEKLIIISKEKTAVSESANMKILNLANDFSAFDVVFKNFTGENVISVKKHLKKIGKYEIKPTEDKEGKRKPGDLALVTQKQLESLVQVTKILGVEALLYENEKDFIDFSMTLSRLYKGKTRDLNEILELLVSLLAKPVGYMRNIVANVFKEFVNEISEEFITKLCAIIESGNFSIDTQNDEEVKEEDQENGVSVLFPSQGSDSRNQEKIIKDNFLIRASEIMEIVVKKAENPDYKLQVYTSLVKALRLASKTKEKQHLVARFSSILSKIHTKDLSLSSSHEEKAESLILLILKTLKSNKTLSNILCKNLISLLKSISIDKSEKILQDLLKKMFEKHNSCLRIENLREILVSLPYNKNAMKQILKYLASGRNQMTQVQASEVLKSICRSWKFTEPKIVKKILRLCRNIEKSEMKIKWKNNIVKNTLCGVISICRNKDNVYDSISEDIEKLKNLQGNKPSLHGIYKDLNLVCKKAQTLE